VLGTNSIEVYTHNPDTGFLTHVYSSPSPRVGVEDGPRHVKIHPNGKVLYCVTEHNNLLDVYSIAGNDDTLVEGTSKWPTNPLTHLGTRSLVPPHLSYPSAPLETVHRFRGDTLMLGPSAGEGNLPTEIWATTRGATEDERGWVSVFELDQDGMLVSSLSDEGVERYETPTSGGKAHAIDLFPKSTASFESTNASHQGSPVWILLTDDSDHAAGEVREPQDEASSSKPIGGVRVLEWNGWFNGGVREVVGWPSEGKNEGLDGELMRGGSHAVWLTIEDSLD